VGSASSPSPRRAHPKRPDEELTVWSIYASESERPPRQAARSSQQPHQREVRQQQAADGASQRQDGSELDDESPF
jgi:hypothetical protein